VVLKVDQDNKLLLLIYKHPSPHWPVIVDARRVVDLLLIDVDALLVQPLDLFFRKLGALFVFAVEFTKDLYYLALNLELAFLVHEGSERYVGKVSPHTQFELRNLLKLILDTSDRLLHVLHLFKLIAVPKVKFRVQILDDGPKDVGKHLVCLIICGHYSDLRLRAYYSTFDTELDVSLLLGGFLLHIGPDFPCQVLLEERIAVIVKFRIGHDRDPLRSISYHLDTVLLELLFRYKVRKVLDLKKIIIGKWVMRWSRNIP
jgi:hypothetical protein